MKRYPELQTECGLAIIDLLDIDRFWANSGSNSTEIQFKYTDQLTVYIPYEEFKKMFIEYHEGLWK